MFVKHVPALKPLCTKAFPKVEVYVWTKDEETHIKMGNMLHHGNCPVFN